MLEPLWKTPDLLSRCIFQGTLWGSPQGGGDEAEVDVLIICILTFWSKAVLLSTLPGGPLEDRRVAAPHSVLYHSPISITDAFPLPLQWVVEAGRGRGTRGGTRYLLEPSGSPGCSVQVPILRGAVGSQMCGG